MDRYWLLTWTTYGTWLPGDPRGSVTSVRDGPGPRAEHDQPGTAWEGPLPRLHAAAAAALKGPPIYLTIEQAEALLGQFRETAAYRRWLLCGAAVMANHVHLVVGVPGDPNAEDLIRDFKAYGSRALNQRWGKPSNGSWWSGGGGSRRKLPDAAAVRAALGYLRNQSKPLLIWIADDQPGEPGASAPGDRISDCTFPPGADAPGSPE
ncbi:MAG TPA: transposase [Gemmataceae bacterium]|nr:transposase [Gemmataceae bacterium]